MMFADFVRASGLIPGEIIPGRWVRCPTETHPRKKNGSYKLAIDGRAGWCQDHAAHPTPLLWRPEGEAELPKIDFEAIERRKAEARRDLIRATQGARQFYLECKPLKGGHPYLDQHGLDMTGCFGLKRDRDGWLVVPASINRNLLSVQRISPEGEKRFWTGASVKGASYTIDRPGASLSVVCEGLATGLAIFAAVPLARVIVAFNAGNLANMKVARGLCVIAADNDYVTEAKIGRNPGVKAAQEAAEALGCGVAVPDGITGTDWCDWRRERIERRPVAKFEAEASIRRAVDAELAAAMARNARFLRSAVAA